MQKKNIPILYFYKLSEKKKKKKKKKKKLKGRINIIHPAKS